MAVLLILEELITTNLPELITENFVYDIDYESMMMMVQMGWMVMVMIDNLMMMVMIMV